MKIKSAFSNSIFHIFCLKTAEWIFFVGSYIRQVWLWVSDLKCFSKLFFSKFPIPSSCFCWSIQMQFFPIFVHLFVLWAVKRHICSYEIIRRQFLGGNVIQSCIGKILRLRGGLLKDEFFIYKCKSGGSVNKKGQDFTRFPSFVTFVKRPLTINCQLQFQHRQETLPSFSGYFSFLYRRLASYHCFLSSGSKLQQFHSQSKLRGGGGASF